MVPSQDKDISKADKGRAYGSINTYKGDKHCMELVRHQQHQSYILHDSYQEPLVVASWEGNNSEHTPILQIEDGKSGASVNYHQCIIPTSANKLEHVVPKQSIPIETLHSIVSHEIPQEESSNSAQGSIQIAEIMHA